MAFELTKRIDLSSWAPDAYIELKPVVMSEYKTLLDKAGKIGEDPLANVEFVSAEISKRLKGGKIGDQAITADNIMELPGEVFIHAFKVLMGNLDPK